MVYGYVVPLLKHSRAVRNQYSQPAVWAMGNLGRAGYGGSLDGMWPYVSTI